MCILLAICFPLHGKLVSIALVNASVACAFNLVIFSSSEDGAAAYFSIIILSCASFKGLRTFLIPRQTTILLVSEGIKIFFIFSTNDIVY